MKEIASAYKILLFSRTTNQVISSYAKHGDISYDWNLLVEKCDDYHRQLEVDGFQVYTDGSLAWQFKNKLYSTEEIDRMLKLKAFT